jgi:hypothetical protein
VRLVDVGPEQIGREDLAHPLRPLREHLERVALGVRHDREDARDVGNRQALVEEIREAVHEHSTRLAPRERLGDSIGDEPHLTSPTRASTAHHGKTAVLRREATVHEPLGVTVHTSRRDA